MVLLGVLVSSVDQLALLVLVATVEVLIHAAAQAVLLVI